MIIDPIIAPIIWQNGPHQAGEVLETIRHLPDVLGYEVKTVTGLSNLTTGSAGHPNRGILEQAYLAMLAGNNLDMVLLNIFHAESVKLARACTALNDDKPFAIDQL